MLTGGRFEFGIGAGLPHATTQAAQELGLPLRSPAERLAAVSEPIDHFRTVDGDTHTPVLIARRRPPGRALAVKKGDIVTLAASPLTSRTELTQMVTDIRTHAGDRAGDIQFAMNLFVIGDQVPPWTKQFIGADAATLIAHDSLTLLRGDTQETADELQQRREDLGVSYVCVNAAYYEQLTPVVELLTGH